MKKIEFIYREILFRCLEKKIFIHTQADLAKSLGLSLSTVNLALRPLRRMNAVSVQQRGFAVKDAKKILFYWASLRNVGKDIVYQTRSERPVRSIESEMPPDAIFAAFSAYKFKLRDVPADYSEVYVYADEADVKSRFSLAGGPPNIIVLRTDTLMGRYRALPLGQLFVDLWNLPQWYAKDFLNALEAKIDGILA